MKAPHTYYEWVEILELFKYKESDDDVLAAIKEGTLATLDYNIGSRLMVKFNAALNYRMKCAGDKFTKEIQSSNGNEAAIVQALLALRKEAALWVEAADIPVFQQNREKIVKNVRDEINKMQTSLDDTAKADRSGKLSSIVRNHRITGQP